MKIKVLGPHMPALPPEIAPGTGIRPVEFSGLVVTAYVSDNGRRPRLAYSFRATGVHAQGKAPAEHPAPRGSGAQHTPGDGKAA